ncbi:MAG: DUF357 domain-containing protein [Methanoregula sp.]|nr:DUF357 domain-containing protein [Methanoregula sp.]
MMIAECRDALAAALVHSHSAASPHTSMEREAFAVMEMAEAYQKDGATFYHKGDLVNALAAFWYGAGWLHFGVSSGLIVYDIGSPFCPFTGLSEKLPLPFSEKLREKTLRYDRLLNTARSSVECAGETETISNVFAGNTLFITALYAAQGARYRESGAYENALTCFSYGHGWLDAGVTCGYFRILAHRDIFTV